LAWKLALVINQKAPLSLLSSYSEERLPVIAEMLQRTTGLYQKSYATNDSVLRVGWFRYQTQTALHMLGVNYRWSPIVIDERARAVGTILNEDQKLEYMASAYGSERSSEDDDRRGQSSRCTTIPYLHN
jgi:hypothetical protein